VNLNYSKSGLCKTLWHGLMLNADFYEQTQSTARNCRIALTIVLLAALSHLLGSTVILLINRAPVSLLLPALMLDGLAVVSGYYLWTFLVFKIGQWLKPIDPTYRDLLSPIGFAYAPQVLSFLTLIPLLGRPIELVLAVWSLLAVIVAVRQGLDIKTRTAALICLIGWIPIQIAIGFIQTLTQEVVSWAA
jgi:hypothetical protein